MSIPARRAAAVGRRRKRRPGSAAHGPVRQPPMDHLPEQEPDRATVAALREWRLAEARRRAIAPFIILHDRTLMAIAAARPRSEGELLAVPGIGPGKAAEYGDAIVAVVRDVLVNPPPTAR